MTLQSLPAVAPLTPPRFQSTLSAAQANNIYALGTWHAVPFDVAPVVTNMPAGAPTIWTSGANASRLVLPAPGVWLVIGHAYITSSGATATLKMLKLNKNAAGVDTTGILAQTLVYGTGATDFIGEITSIVQANGTTDYVELFGYSAITTWGFGAGGSTSLQAILLGSI